MFGGLGLELRFMGSTQAEAAGTSSHKAAILSTRVVTKRQSERSLALLHPGQAGSSRPESYRSHPGNHGICAAPALPPLASEPPDSFIFSVAQGTELREVRNKTARHNKKQKWALRD